MITPEELAREMFYVESDNNSRYDWVRLKDIDKFGRLCNRELNELPAVVAKTESIFARLVRDVREENLRCALRDRPTPKSTVDYAEGLDANFYPPWMSSKAATLVKDLVTYIRYLEAQVSVMVNDKDGDSLYNKGMRMGMEMAVALSGPNGEVGEGILKLVKEMVRAGSMVEGEEDGGQTS